jgi:predicted peptidase
VNGRWLIATLAGVWLMAGITRADDKDWKSMLEKHTFEYKDGKPIPYRLLKPDNIDPKKKYPLVLFLHGAGERGNDNEKQLVHGVAEFAKAENRKKYPCFLVAPQCPTGQGWSDFLAKPGKTAKKQAEPGAAVFDLICGLTYSLPIDCDRVYITGLSMGGYGTWDLITRNPGFFAAAVPICGGGDPTQAEKIAKMPIWVFHGGKDPVVKPERSREMVEAIKKAGGEPKYTEYPDVGHNSWVKAYQDADMMKWLFEQKRK